VGGGSLADLCNWGGVRWERRGDGKGGGGDEMRDYCEVGFFAGRFGGIF